MHRQFLFNWQVNIIYKQQNGQAESEAKRRKELKELEGQLEKDELLDDGRK